MPSTSYRVFLQPLLLLAVAAFGTAQAACPPTGSTRASLTALKAADFAIKDDKERQELAVGLLDCLGHADPFLRDGVAYEALNGWMRGKDLSLSTVRTLHERLATQLETRDTDKAGFRQPFAALVMASVVAADRERRVMDDQAYADLIEIAADYFESIRDYRGFDARAGWRHGIAHGADLLTQLAVHPRTRQAQVDRIVGALATQIAPASGHFYIYGEPERMALPLVYIAQRGIYSVDEWSEWFAGIADIPEQGNLYGSQAALARRHNLQALLLVLHVNASESEDEGLRTSLLPAVTASLRLLQ
jgi:hypothetical protein